MPPTWGHCLASSWTLVRRGESPLPWPDAADPGPPVPGRRRRRRAARSGASEGEGIPVVQADSVASAGCGGTTQRRRLRSCSSGFPGAAGLLHRLHLDDVLVVLRFLPLV